jgi:hypothetical protein
VGQAVTIEGLDFLVSSAVTVTVQSPLGRMGIFSSQITSDASGEIASTDIANYATAILTSNGTDVSVNDTVTIGAVTYTFKAAPTTVANEIKIGGTATLTLDNVKKAVNLTGVSGTDYGSATVIHPTARASAKTATTLLFVAKTAGTGGNALAFAKVAVTLSVSGATFAGGAAASGLYTFSFTPTGEGIWTVSATDGTNAASANIKVHSGS